MKVQACFTALLMLTTGHLLAEGMFDITATASQWQTIAESDELQPFTTSQKAPKSKESGTLLGVWVEHEVSALPNMGALRSKFSTNTSLVANATPKAGTKGVGSEMLMAANMDVNHDSLLLFYDVVDQVIKLDLGLNVTKIDDQYRLDSSLTDDQAQLKDFLVGPYAKLSMDIPRTSMTLTASSMIAGQSDFQVMKNSISLGWTSEVGVGLELGYQSFTMGWSSQKFTDINIKMDGFFLGLSYTF